MNRFSAIRRLADKTAEKYSLEPPVDVESIFDELGITIEEEENQYGIEAYSSLKGKIRVVMNTEFTYAPRRRFTLAHELGHIIIPWHNGDTKCIAGDNNYTRIAGKKYLDTQELEANIFASEILMPIEWLKEKISENRGTFKDLIKNVAAEAKTSIMATFFALEQAMPSGNVFFVRRENAEYHQIFCSKNTCTVNLSYYPEENMQFLDMICEEREEFSIGSYKVVYYHILECPGKNVIKEIYRENGGSVELLLDKISRGHSLKTVPFLDVVLDEISKSSYVAFIICGDDFIKAICDYKSPVKMFYRRLQCTELCNVAEAYGFNYEEIELEEEFRIVYIEEKYFTIPYVEKCDPNQLLKEIMKELYEDERERRHVLQSINGIMASVNSMHSRDNREVLYNWAKYRFLTDENLSGFGKHRYFEKYLVNKIDKMIAMRQK